jgi:hypothetical protein
MALTYVNQVGAPDGLNQAMPATTLPDTYVRWAQDALFDQVGTIRRRGPFGLISLTDSTGANASQPTPVTSTTAERVLGTVGTKNPLGVQVLALFVHNNAVDAVDPSSRATIAEAIKVYAYDSSYRTKSTSTVRTFAATDADFTCDSTAIFYSTPALGGGAWISILDDYIPASSSNAQTLVYWRGGVGSEDTAGLSCTIGVTGSGDPSTYTDQITSSALFGDITSGMFAFDVVGGEDYYLGVVKSVDSTSAITLEKKALRTALGATDDASANTTSRTVRFTNTRPYIHNHGRGLLTSPVPAAGSAITSGNEGGSGEGHWKSAGLNATWALYKNSDHTWVGNIATITNNASGTLSATHFNSALTAFANEEYVAYPVSYTMSANAQAGVDQRSTQKFGGVFAATYQGYQWYANCGVGDKGNRIVFSASSNPESVDLSKDAADSIELPGTKEIRGIATSSAGLLVFTADKTYIIRGNERNNFSLEELYPEGCLCTSSIVEYGGGVFWVSKSGFLLYDGGSVRLLTRDNLGVFYTDSIKNFNASVDRVYSFFYKNYLFVYFTIFQTPFSPERYEPLYVTGWTTTNGISGLPWSGLDDAFEWDDFKNDSKTPVYWDSQKMFETIGAEAQGIAALFDSALFGADESGLYKFGPLNFTDGMVFALYLPTGSVTTLSNMDFRGATIIETANGTNCLLGVTADVSDNQRARIIDLDPVIDTNTVGRDPILIYNNVKTEALYRKGPDFFLQTKAYTVGDPVLKKWFQRLLINMKLNDGAVRFDIIDDEDNDDVNISLKAHRNWELFTPQGYNWTYVESVLWPKYSSSNATTWLNVYNQEESWVDLLDPAFERFKKRFSWRSNSAGIRLYQLNDYEAPNTPDGTINLPNDLIVSSWNVGFKPMRQGRQ